MYVRPKKEKGRTKPEQEQIWNRFKMYQHNWFSRCSKNYHFLEHSKSRTVSPFPLLASISCRIPVAFIPFLACSFRAYYLTHDMYMYMCVHTAQILYKFWQIHVVHVQYILGTHTFSTITSLVFILALNSSFPQYPPITSSVDMVDLILSASSHIIQDSSKVRIQPASLYQQLM